MEDRDLKFENTVLNKGIKEVIRMAKNYTELDDDEIANNYEEAIKISTIHSILKLKDFLDDFQETAQIAQAGILESIAVEQYNDQLKNRINAHDRLVDMNNTFADILQDLVIDVIGQDKMKKFAMEVQIDSLL